MKPLVVKLAGAQEMLRKGACTVMKLPRSVNMSDMMTHPLSSGEMKTFPSPHGVVFDGGQQGLGGEREDGVEPQAGRGGRGGGPVAGALPDPALRRRKSERLV